MTLSTTRPKVVRLAEGAIFRKILALSDIEAEDLTMLDALPLDVHAHRKNAPIIDHQTMRARLFIVLSGWCYSYSFLPNGRRQVYRIYQEGDIIGLEDLMLTRNSFSVSSLTNSRLGEVNVPDMRRILERHPRLASYIYAVCSLEHVVLMDRMQAIARLRPLQRLGRFLLETANRIRITSVYHSGETLQNMTFALPMQQDLLADCVGLTAVHVSRTLKQMERDGLIARPQRNLVTILDEQELVTLSNFQNRYVRNALKP